MPTHQLLTSTGHLFTLQQVILFLPSITPVSFLAVEEEESMLKLNLRESHLFFKIFLTILVLARLPWIFETKLGVACGRMGSRRNMQAPSQSWGGRERNRQGWSDRS
jgi:hypothetical protein